MNKIYCLNQIKYYGMLTTKINNWLNEKIILEPFDVDVVAGDGTTIHTWAFVDCEPSAFGTYLQDVQFYYQLVEDVPEIRERATFSCRVDLEVP